MPLPHWIAVLNKRFTNRFIEPVVRRTRHFAVVTHTGRVTGRRYRTPVFVFPGESRYWYVALTYGPGVDWVRNLARGDGSCRHGATTHGIEDVVVVGRSEAWQYLPRTIRAFLRLMRVRDFARLALTQP